MTDGVLLIAHGTVESLDELPAFVAKIRHGRPPPPGLLDELRRRYALIGRSPLLEVTRAQAAALEARLGVPVLVGMRLWRPFVEDVLVEAAERGLTRLAAVPLAPYSAAVYAAAAERALASAAARLDGRRVELRCAAPWGVEPALVGAHAALIRAALGGDDDVALVMTAHSLPSAAIRAGDRYEAEVRASAAAVGALVDRPFRLAFQSQGADGGEWLGPGLRDALEAARAAGARRAVVAPIGFLADHVETLYDLDVEARDWARALGLELARVPALGAHPGLVEALARVAERTLAGR